MSNSQIIKKEKFGVGKILADSSFSNKYLDKLEPRITELRGF